VAVVVALLASRRGCAQPMADRSILRIGPITGTDDCGATFLRDAILRHFRVDDCSGGANDNDQSASLTISNRYFTAHVALLRLDETISYDGSSSNSNDNGSSITTTTVEEDGILLVFDDRSSHSFDSLGHIHDTFVVPSAIGDLLRMCIGTHASTDNVGSSTASIIDKDEYSRRVLWCLDRGYEYVSVDLSTHGMTTGFDVRDKDGYARVIEAIETCMWSCRIMKSSPGREVQSSSSSSVQQQCAAKGGNGDSVAGMTNKIAGTGLARIDDTTIPLMTDDERESAAIASLMNGTVNDDDGNGDYIPPSLDEDGESMRRQQQQQREEEISFHQLEKVLTEAKSIREASRNNANMSNEERRARAGDAAMKLMGLLDRLGFDDDDDEEEDCDSDDRELTGS
jgi:hypothetical protein